jgi:hypothetical protein
MADLGAAFGFYPQLNRRRQGSPADSANLPVDVLRGRFAGLLGLLPDTANLLRSPSPTEMFGDVSYEAPAQFPYTTEKFLKDLPLAPTSRVGKLAGQAASFVPLNPMPAVRGVQKVGQVVGEELAATMLGQRPNSMMSKVVPQPLFAVAPEQGLLATKTEPIESLLQTKPQAPVSDIGFYSATEQAALNLGRNKGTGQSFINDLMKAPDVKKEELAYTGLDDFLRDKPNVTKQEVQDFLANNRVDVQETQLGGALSPEMQQRIAPTPETGLLGQEVTEYRGSHTAPNAKTYGATLDSLQNIMPADVYSSKGMNLYGIGDRQIDSEWFRAAYLAKGNPDKLIEVYRAVPKGVKGINEGDWVTTSKTYAKNHGESALDGDYEIITKKVKASTLSSEGYPYEFGYNE